ncbi:NFACT RNA binding domain-containing protein [Bdellovibrionota bacterium FG-2]
MQPSLNWKEIAHLALTTLPKVRGQFVDRVFVPARPRHPQGFIKSEWVLRLSSCELFISVRPQTAFFALAPLKTFKPARDASRSAFDLALSKHLAGSKLLDLRALDQERMVIFTFSCDQPQTELGLFLNLIPASPEALLVLDRPENLRADHFTNVMARTRTIDESLRGSFEIPKGKPAPQDLPLRPQTSTPELFFKFVEQEHLAEVLKLRIQRATQILKHQIKDCETRFRQAETALKEAQTEPDWHRMGALLTQVLHDPPLLERASAKSKYPDIRRVHDFRTETLVEIPCDPKLDAKSQAARFFANSKRTKTRIAQGQMRIEDFSQKLKRLKKLAELELPPGEWSTLESLESELGLGTSQGDTKTKPEEDTHPGRAFNSLDSWLIRVGRNKDENLELTVRLAKGNDIWLHLRGKPGSHVLIPCRSGKSVPLETLLDAAHLCVYYSGGKDAGKTEVDYTFRKHVKRIKGSDEVSYTQNRTLVIEPDPIRLQRLLSQYANT